MTGRLDLLADGVAAVVGLALAVTAGLWPQTGGAYFAQEGTQGAIRLLMQVPVAGLRAATLDTLLQGLAGTADAWAETLARPERPAPAPATPPPGPGWMA